MAAAGKTVIALGGGVGGLSATHEHHAEGVRFPQAAPGNFPL